MKLKKKIVLAYSGGLDTSIILKWLQENYNSEVIAYTADIGQEIDKKKILKNAKALGVTKVIVENLKDVFVKEYIYPMIRGHAVYEGVYLLGTSIARPLIAKRQIHIAKKYKFDISQESFAWLADDKEEKKMIKTMKKGSRIMITGYNQEGSQTIDHYSLLGFTKAYNIAKKSCS